MTDEEHNKYIAWAFLGHGSLHLLMVCVLACFFGFLILFNPDPVIPVSEILIFLAIFTLFSLIFIVPYFVAGYAIKNRLNWARQSAIVASVMAAMSFPLGTLAAAYALWFFIGDRWRSVYQPLGFSNSGSSLNPGVPDPKWEGRFIDQRGEVIYRPAEIPDWH